MKILQIIGLLAVLMLNSGCIALFAGAAAGGAAGAAGGVYLKGKDASDAVLKERVLNMLQNDPQLRAFKLDVAAESGVVKIYGFIPHAQVEHDVMRAVRAVEGVQGVISRMIVVAGAPLREAPPPPPSMRQ